MFGYGVELLTGEIQLICKRIPSKAAFKGKPSYSGLDCWAQLFVDNPFLHPLDLTCNKQMNDVYKTFLFQGGIFRFHVRFQACKSRRGSYRVKKKQIRQKKSTLSGFIFFL